MIYQKLEAHIHLVEKKFSSCRKFPENPNKQKLYDHISYLLTEIKTINFKEEVWKTTTTNRPLYAFKSLLDRMFENIEHLHYDNEDEDYSKELIHCLELAYSEWKNAPRTDYFIAISYNSNLSKFEEISYPDSGLTALNSQLMTTPSVKKLQYDPNFIQISKPRILFDDYLCSVGVYHELGHAVDKQNNIIDDLFADKEFLATMQSIQFQNLGYDLKKDDLLLNDVKDICNEIKIIKKVQEQTVIARRHYKEYFCDLFAARYVGWSLIDYLRYFDFSPYDNPTDTYPTLTSRINVTRAFLEKTGSQETGFIVNNIEKSCFKNTKVNLLKPIHNGILDEDPFQRFEPVKIKDPNKVHLLFLRGWECWLNRSHSIHTKYPDSSVCYVKINELIKQSITMSI